MDGRARQVQWLVVALTGTLVLGGLALGSGPQNGDAAVYLHQARWGGLDQRVVHVGYLALAKLLGVVVGDRLGLWLDGLALLCSLGCVGVVAWWSGRRGGSYGLVALIAAGVVLPHSGFAEVDTLWWLAVLVALASPGPLLTAIALGVAILVSPAALLALPALVMARDPQERWGLLSVAALIVLGLTLGSSGGWWIGDRGVLLSHARPGRALLEWARSPWILTVPLWFVARPPGGWWWLLLLLAPPDVAAWTVPAMVLGLGARGRPGAWVAVGCGLLGAVQLAQAVHRVRAENTAIQRVAEALDPVRDGLIAPWSLGVRVSLRVTGDPYLLRWRPLAAPLRGQAGRWCGAAMERVVVMPAGAKVPGEVEWSEGPAGCWLGRAVPEVWASLPGCE